MPTIEVGGSPMTKNRVRAKFAGLVLLALGLAFYLAFTIGEVAGGDISGIQHFPPALLLGLLLVVAWKHPLAAGSVLLVLAVPLGVAYIIVLVQRDLPLTWALVVAAPPLVTGLLLVWAGRQERIIAPHRA